MLGRSVRTETTAAMRLPAFVSTILVGALAALPQLLWAAPDSPTADRKLLSRLATQTGAHTAPPRPSLSEYAATVAQDVLHRLFGWIHFPNINLTGLGPLLQVVGYGLAAAYWWRRFRAALKRRDSVTAMESLWFWVAVRLTGTAVDPSWTSRELLNQAKRDDLRPAMMQLDGWRFGPSTPTPDALGGLAARLGEVLG